MKVAVSAIFLLIFGNAFAQQFAPYSIADIESKGYAALRANNNRGAVVNNNITHVKLQIAADPAVNFIRGAVTTTFIANDELDALQFDMSDTLIVDSIVYHQLAVIAYTYQDDILTINLPATIMTGATDSIIVYYHGSPGQTGFGSFVVDTHETAPVMWTLSEPYGAKDWWPCKQNLSDKIDSIDIFITTSSIYRAASNGLLVEETIAGSNTTYHWQHRYPIATYLVAFAVTNYVQYTDYVPYNSDTLEMLNYVYPQHLEYAQQSTPLCGRFIQLFDSLFGIYPFQNEKYGHAEFGRGGGMEHQTMSFMGDFGFELMAHELAHQWFGNKITCASWQEIWLNESFATYLTGVCYERVAPIYDVPYREIKLRQAVSQPGGSVFCYDTTELSRVFSGVLTYSKGAMVLNMLRYIIGDDAFWAGLKNYMNDLNLTYKFATTPVLKAHLEATSGKDLTEFFDTWIYKEGYPQYTVNWKQDFDGKVVIDMQQTWSHPSVSFYSLPVPVLFKGQGMDTLVVLENNAPQESFSVNLPFITDTMIFDPDIMLVTGNNSISRNSAYEYSMMVYPNPVTDVLHVRLETEKSRNSDIEIVDISGSVVYRQGYNLQPGSNAVKIDMSNMAKGTYTVRVKDGLDMIPKKFVKK